MPKGSKPRPPEYLIGLKFGRLVVLSLKHVPGKRPGVWGYRASCLCDCGVTKEVHISALKYGRTVSCGCYLRQRVRESNTGERNARYQGFREIRGKLWSGYQRDAARRGLSFQIPIEHGWDLYESQTRVCKLSGVPIGFGRGAVCSETTASLDRLNSSLGYEIGNVQWTHKTINLMRHKLSVEAFVSLCTKVTHSTSMRLERAPDPVPQILRVERPSKHTGASFSRLTIKSVARQVLPYIASYADALCECGNMITVRLDSITSGKTQSCGCLQYRGFREIRGHLWAGYLDSAKRREIPFHLSMADAWRLYEDQGRVCVLSLEPIHFGTSFSGTRTTASLDRIDNTLGYTIDNVQWVSKSINLMRRTLTVTEFKDWCKKVVEWQSRI